MMIIEIVVSLLLLIASYAGVCHYYRKDGEFCFKELFRLSKWRMLYLSLGIVADSAMLFCLNYFYSDSLMHAIRMVSVIMIILSVAAVDYRDHLMPNKFLIVALIMRVVIWLVELLENVELALETAADCAIAALIVGAFFFLLLLLFKNSIGMGDVKLFAIMGLYQGLWGTINAIFFSLLITFFVSVFLLITKKRGRKDMIAFGPSIFLGTVIGICLSGM